MKRISVLASILVVIISFASCKKDKVEPSFVDDYNAPLTEEKGTEHLGDYFPLAEGYSWNYSGREETVGESTISGGGYNETEPINEGYNISNYIKVNPLESITLTSGNYNLYPIEESYDAYGYDYRYYEKTSDAVYCRAFKVDGSEILEVKNPVFIKKPLVVGDSWEIQPSISLETEMEVEDLDFSLGEGTSLIKCKIYVIGEESVSWNGQNALPVRLDERVEASFTFPVNEPGFSGKVEINVELMNIIYLLENVGMIKQEMAMTAKSSTNISAQGEKITAKVNFETEVDLSLDSYDVMGKAVKKSIKITDEEGKVLNIGDNPILNKINVKLQKACKIVSKLAKF